MDKIIDVYIVGSKGIPAKYGGFETFVEELTKGKVSQNIKYHVSCMNNEERHFEHNGADCFNVKVPFRGPVGRILHVSRALKQIEDNYNKDNINIVYILGCRIGPLMRKHYKKLKKRGFKVYVNPDGLEWKRDKWNSFEKHFLKYCEKCLVLNSDLAICDSKNIEKYINETYKGKVKLSTYIAYGSNICESKCSQSIFENWCKKYAITKDGYYLIVGRFVPENNYETMIREFMKSATQRDLVIISNVEKNSFYKELSKKTRFELDKRIKFVGTVYDQELLKKIRENAFAYLHGHEVGGTNPSLLEALGSTRLNLLLNVSFNKEVGENAALYWGKQPNSLKDLIDSVDFMAADAKNKYGNSAKTIISTRFSWDFIVEEYEKLFNN